MPAGAFQIHSPLSLSALSIASHPVPTSGIEWCGARTPEFYALAKYKFRDLRGRMKVASPKDFR